MAASRYVQYLCAAPVLLSLLNVPAPTLAESKNETVKWDTARIKRSYYGDLSHRRRGAT